MFGSGNRLIWSALFVIAGMSSLASSLDIATFSMEGVRGRIVFWSKVSWVQGRITLTGQNAANYTKLIFTQFPPMFGQHLSQSEECKSLGKPFRVITGITPNKSLSHIIRQQYRIFSKGVLLRGAGVPDICAAILPEREEEVDTYRAQFNTRLVGNIWFRTRETTGWTFIMTDLAFSDNRADPTKYTILKLFCGDNGEEGKDKVRQRVLFKVGNSVLSPDKRQAFYVSYLHWPTTSSLYIGGSSLGADIAVNASMVGPKIVRADLNWDGVTGSIEFQQANPFTATTTLVSLNHLRHLPVSYHIHKFPVPQRQSTDYNMCGNPQVGGHFNPYNVTTWPPKGTEDQYEVGDLSGKYGVIESESVKAHYTDWNLPLFGPNSVVWRSIVIHRSDSTRWICASIGYDGDLVTAIVRFKSPAYGNIYLRQSGNDGDGDTSVFGELANMNNAATLSHNWHVHERPVADDCASTGPHYNPGMVSVSGNYSTLCSSSNPLRCELGDLSGKLGTIFITTSLDTGDSKFFFTDSYLPLSGDLSVIGRSVVVHAANRGAPRYACADIHLLRPLQLQSDGWQGDHVNASLLGDVYLTQDSEFDATQVDIGPVNLPGPSLYNIFDLSMAPLSRCSGVGLTFNPFNAHPGHESRTFDQYPVGGLSGKFGNLQPHKYESYTDNNLPLYTDVGVAGRALVIQKTDGSARKCTNLNLTPLHDKTAYVTVAQASFSVVLYGYVQMKQIMYADGTTSPTTIEVYLQYPDEYKTTSNHNWHVHIAPITDENECAVAQGHYDPYNAQSLSSSYPDECSRTNPLACEVGDLSAKHRRYTIGGSRKHFIDVDLPLLTDKSILGRSIVFHAKDAGAARIACANIYPASNLFTIQFASTVQYFASTFISAVATSTGVDRMRIVILYNTQVPTPVEMCSKLVIHIAGDLPASKQQDLIVGKGMWPYVPTLGCANSFGK